MTQAATLAVAILACVAPFLGNQKKGGLFGTPRLAETQSFGVHFTPPGAPPATRPRGAAAARGSSDRGATPAGSAEGFRGNRDPVRRDRTTA